MGLLGKVIGGALGVTTVKTKPEELAKIINDHFIVGADIERLKVIQKTVGAMMFKKDDLYSDDGDYMLYCNPNNASVFVKQFSTNTVFENETFLGSGKGLPKLRKLVKKYCEQELIRQNSTADLSTIAIPEEEEVGEEVGETVEATTERVDKVEELKKIKELLDSGILTQEEFDTEKKKILQLD